MCIYVYNVYVLIISFLFIIYHYVTMCAHHQMGMGQNLRPGEPQILLRSNVRGV